jgi:hypothetical protein
MLINMHEHAGLLNQTGRQAVHTINTGNMPYEFERPCCAPCHTVIRQAPLSGTAAAAAAAAAAAMAWPSGSREQHTGEELPLSLLH